jgi:hypothetical protein
MLLRKLIISVKEMNFLLKILKFDAETNVDVGLTFARWCTSRGQKSQINLEGTRK